jgi:hypothetical protein
MQQHPQIAYFLRGRNYDGLNDRLMGIHHVLLNFALHIIDYTSIHQALTII